MKELWNTVKNWFKNAVQAIKNWWNAPVNPEELVKLVEQAQAEGRELEEWETFGNPVRRIYEKYKKNIDLKVGKGSFAVLVGCTAVLGFIALTGSASILAVLGIGLATVYGGYIAIQRFPRLERFITKWYKWIDITLFAVGFYLANSIFGFQVAAVTGLLVSIALILWKANKEGAFEKAKQKAIEFKNQIMEAVEESAQPVMS